MTPQANVMVTALIEPSREAELRQLLAGMNLQPGVVDPRNSLLPFEHIDTLHFARFVILEDDTRDDLLLYNQPPASAAKSLALLCDFDGSSDAFLDRLVAVAGQGLVRIFSCCQSPPSSTNLASWLRDHEQKSSASYVNWIGRTALQVREEDRLYRILEDQLTTPEMREGTPRQIWSGLRAFISQEQAAGRISLTPPQPTPLGWKIRNLLHCIAVPLVLLLLSPLILIYLPFFLIQLRIHEDSDPVIAPRPPVEHVHELDVIEDRLPVNQFSAYGNIKPGPFRRWTITAVFFAIDYTARHIFNRGFLARVTTIHFARWVFLDDHKRAFFASNYDGSLEAYMGDFINKVAWGLNIVFSNGLGYPKTKWLIVDGAKNELTFKDYLRRHQLPTQVWYNASPGLTAPEMKRNALIRAGLEKPSISDVELQQWVALL
jgi:hypothetical protein